LQDSFVFTNFGALHQLFCKPEYFFMLTAIKDLATGQRKRFARLCAQCTLPLDYRANRREFALLRSIFVNREYADLFPFYEPAVIVDVGAHHGYFSLFASRNAGPEARIYAFEPNRHNFARLQQNLAACSAANVKPFHCAIGGEAGRGQLFAGDSVNHSLRQDYRLAGGAGTSEEVEVKTLAQVLDENQLERVDFLKLDCEGAEYDILGQAPPQVLARCETISMEFHDLKDARYTGKVLAQQLLGQGFEIWKFEHGPTNLDFNYGKIVATRLFRRWREAL
jgi:FkbM family methyltransferase